MAENNSNLILIEESRDMQSTSQVSYYAFLVFTFILIGRPQEVFPLFKFVRPVLVFSIINIILANPVTVMFSRPLGKKYLAFYGIMLLGIPFALYRRAAFEFAIFHYIVNMLYFGLLIIHIDSYKRMRMLVLILVSSICFFGIASLRLGTSNEGRLAFGSTYDPNDLAYLLVTLIPFTILFISEKGRTFAKLFAVTTGIISIWVVLLTGSRGGMIGFAITLVLFLLTDLIPVRRMIKIGVVIVIVFFALANKDIIFSERYSSILRFQQDYNVIDELGRLQLWRKGLEFTLERPLLGIGAQCFPTAIGLERRKRHVIERWQVVHNSYLQISSELGLVAFIIYLLMIKDTIKIFRKVRHGNGDRMRISDTQRLAGIAQIGFISHLIVAFFLTHGYSILFSLFFALAAAFSNFAEVTENEQ